MSEKPMNSAKKTSFSQVDLAQIAKKHDEKGTAEQHFDMHIDEMGKWFHQGDEIKRQSLVKLFASVLTRLDDDEYWLITPAERGKITVADVPFFVNTMRLEGEGDDQVIYLKTSLDDEVALGSDHHIRIDDTDPQKGPRPYVNIKGRLDALIARSVYYDLAELAEEQDERFFIKSAGEVIAIS